MEKLRCGIIEIPQELLLRFIQYPGGIIHSIDMPADRVGIIRIQLEHPEIPELETGFCVPTIIPEYATYEDCLGHKVSVRKKGIRN